MRRLGFAMLPAAVAALLLSAAALAPAPAKAAPITYCNTPMDTVQALINTCVLQPVNSQLVPAGGQNISSAIYLPSVANAVNLLSVTPGATGAAVLLTVGGDSSDTNDALVLSGKGTGAAHLGGTTAANASLRVPTVASAVNQVQISGAVTSGIAGITVGGSGADTNAPIALSGAGTGAVLVGGGTTTLAGLQVAQTASRVNDIVVTPAATGTAPSIAVGGAGADANRNLSIAGSGTGIVALGQTTCSSSGATPQTCNGQRGLAVTDSLTTAHNANASYVIANSSVATTSMVQCMINGYSGTISTNGVPVITQCVPGSGSITVNIFNADDTNALSGTVTIGFVVLK